MNKPNRKLGQTRPDGYAALRVYHRKSRGKHSPRLLIKCGDCSNQLEIFYDPECEDLEIGGVLASTMNWREILLPLLKPLGRPYGATAKELDRFAARMSAQTSRDRKAGTVKRYSGDFEADIAD